MKKLKIRFLGALIVVKVLVPFIIVAVALVGSTVTGIIIKGEIDIARNKLSEQMATARDQARIVMIESQRLLNEARNIKEEAKEFAQDVKNIVKPLKGALNGLSKSMSTIARTIQNIINSIISAVNKLPFQNLPRVRLANYFKVPAFDIDLPNVNLQVSEEAYTAIRKVSEASHNIAMETGQTLERLRRIFDVWWYMAQITFFLIVIWFILGIAGYLARSKHRLSSGWKMVKGDYVENALMLL